MIQSLWALVKETSLGTLKRRSFPFRLFMILYVAAYRLNSLWTRWLMRPVRELQGTSHELSRGFNRDEIHRILGIAPCLPCHDRYDDTVWSKPGPYKKSALCIRPPRSSDIQERPHDLPGQRTSMVPTEMCSNHKGRYCQGLLQF